MVDYNLAVAYFDALHLAEYEVSVFVRYFEEGAIIG